MTEEQHEAVVRIVNEMLRKMREQVNNTLSHPDTGLTDEMKDLIRTMLTEQARFWA